MEKILEKMLSAESNFTHYAKRYYPNKHINKINVINEQKYNKLSKRLC